MIESVDPNNGNENPDAAHEDNSDKLSRASSRGGHDVSESEDEEGEAALIFNIKLDRAEPAGTALSKKANLCVHIQPDQDVMAKEDYLQQKMLEYILQQREATWLQQFKIACMLGPTIDEDN